MAIPVHVLSLYRRSVRFANVFYRLTVYDIHAGDAGAQKIFFNYPGPPAPAVTDASAFATCP